MTVAVVKLVKDVRVAIDMNRRDESLAGIDDPDTLLLDELIRSKVCEGIDLVHLSAPLRLLEPVSIGDEALPGHKVTTDSEGKGRIALPENYLRLAMFRIEGWRRAVYEALSEDDPRYQMQSSRWKGIYGNEDKPVVALIRRNDRQLYLEFYSSQTDRYIIDSGHILRAEIDDEDNVTVSSGCYRAAVYKIGALVLASLGDQQSAVMDQLSEGMLQ